MSDSAAAWHQSELCTLTYRSFHARQAIEYGMPLSLTATARRDCCRTLTHPRIECRWWYKSQESWGDTLGPSCIQECCGCYERSGSRRFCHLCAVCYRNSNISLASSSYPHSPPVAAAGIEEAIAAEIPLVVWLVRSYQNMFMSSS